jgi:thymidylate kinase
MQNKVYQVFTHKDLDGAISLLTFLWSHPKDTVTYQEISNLDIKPVKDYINKTINPPKTLLFNLHLREDFFPDLDQENIVIIDHHIDSKKYINRFQKSKILHQNYNSGSMFIRKLFQNNFELTNEQKKLILLADDFESRKYQFEESYDLNIIFWTEFKNDFSRFINAYKNGFKPFAKHQIEIIKNVKSDANQKLLETKCYAGQILIEGQPKKVLAAMTNKFNSIVIDKLLQKHKPELLFYINTQTEYVSIRQPHQSNMIDLLRFSEKYCDGNGHSFAAGGKITPLFMELTKNLNPL